MDPNRPVEVSGRPLVLAAPFDPDAVVADAALIDIDLRPEQPAPGQEHVRLTWPRERIGDLTNRRVHAWGAASGRRLEGVVRVPSGNHRVKRYRSPTHGTIEAVLQQHIWVEGLDAVPGDSGGLVWTLRPNGDPDQAVGIITARLSRYTAVTPWFAFAKELGQCRLRR